MDLLNVWKGRNEEIIQDCLEEAYIKKGYKVTNYHKTDRRHEGGVDLLCENVNEKIKISVKIKPVKSDIKQLKKLLKSKATKKIYVYVENPVVAFKKEMKKTKNIDFWDKGKLHDFLIENESTKYLRIFFLSSNLVKRIVDTLETIASTITISPEPLNNNQIGLWWLLKDRAVKLHGSFELLRDYYQMKLLKKDKIEKRDIKNYLKNISKFFDIIDRNSATDLYSVIEKIKKSHPQLLSEYIRVTKDRSNWLEMPYDVRTDDIRKLIEKWVIPEVETSYSFYNQINFYLMQLKEVAKAIEDGVDWVAGEKFGSMPK